MADGREERLERKAQQDELKRTRRDERPEYDEAEEGAPERGGS